MKRMTWLLIAVFCTAFVRVQPVELTHCSQCVTCHCKIPGACGMPCSGTPAPAMFAAAQSTKIAHAAGSRNLVPVPLTARKFYLSCVEPAARSVAFIAPVSIAMPSAVPLFKAHCSFLI
jgi:hypothetical protein